MQFANPENSLSLAPSQASASLSRRSFRAPHIKHEETDCYSAKRQQEMRERIHEHGNERGPLGSASAAENLGAQVDHGCAAASKLRGELNRGGRMSEERLEGRNRRKAGCTCELSRDRSAPPV